MIEGVSMGVRGCSDDHNNAYHALHVTDALLALAEARVS